PPPPSETRRRVNAPNRTTMMRWRGSSPAPTLLLCNLIDEDRPGEALDEGGADPQGTVVAAHENVVGLARGEKLPRGVQVDFVGEPKADARNFGDARADAKLVVVPGGFL